MKTNSNRTRGIDVDDTIRDVFDHKIPLAIVTPAKLFTISKGNIWIAVNCHEDLLKAVLDHTNGRIPRLKSVTKQLEKRLDEKLTLRHLVSFLHFIYESTVSQW